MLKDDWAKTLAERQARIEAEFEHQQALKGVTPKENLPSNWLAHKELQLKKEEVHVHTHQFKVKYSTTRDGEAVAWGECKCGEKEA